MFCQAACLLYLQVKTRRFYLFKSNELGLVQVNCSNMCGLNFFVYSALAVVDLASKDFKEVIGRPYRSWQIFLFGTRFIVALDTTWSFFWVCVVHCATIKCRSPVSGTPLGRSLIPRSISYAMNISVILAVVWPIGELYSKVVKKISIVTNLLKTSASSYCLDTYITSDLWIKFIPASSVLVHQAYIPCLIGVVKSMCHRGLIPAGLSDDFQGKSAEAMTIRSICKKEVNVDQKNAVVLLALFAYVSTLVHVPVLIWSVGGNE
ncbi:hypothetical protein CROQUDRAFT_52482 [Cronartium quercuum f. sp. fusiforme G11]|uniref:Uncharacterized protein n=1 Tax=Cronartium quercuum f. sp. fusiforme G11 TaxID=708437 RepID=A0A9P6NC05_9BASI|nr:hypothetical protein CROQUDRAFT_52482 [Cronartium quercuum f. sp. fusiforme G11]